MDGAVSAGAYVQKERGNVLLYWENVSTNCERLSCLPVRGSGKLTANSLLRDSLSPATKVGFL